MTTYAILDENGKIKKIISALKEIEKLIDNLPNLIISNKERVIIKKEIVTETVKEYYETYPNDKRKKPKLVKKEYYDIDGKLIKEVVVDKKSVELF